MQQSDTFCVFLISISMNWMHFSHWQWHKFAKNGIQGVYFPKIILHKSKRTKVHGHSIIRNRSIFILHRNRNEYPYFWHVLEYVRSVPQSVAMIHDIILWDRCMLIAFCQCHCHQLLLAQLLYYAHRICFTSFFLLSNVKNVLAREIHAKCVGNETTETRQVRMFWWCVLHIS